jgi:hypothetical protein
MLISESVEIFKFDVIFAKGVGILKLVIFREEFEELRVGG